MLLDTAWIRPENSGQKGAMIVARLMAILIVIHVRSRDCNGFSRCRHPHAREFPCLKGNCNCPIYHPILWPQIKLSWALRHSSRSPRWYWLTYSKHVIMNTCKPHEDNLSLENECMVLPPSPRSLKHHWEEER